MLFDRNMDQELGLDSGPKPRIWRVYKRKKGFNVKYADVAG
jgi:hypothetical protein